MDVPAARRRGNLYGKGARKARVHDIFDIAAQTPVENPPTLTPCAPVLSRPRQATNTPHIQLQNELREAAINISGDTKEDSSAGTVPSPLIATESSTMFDLHSSEEEPTWLKPKRALKKRKIASVKPNQPRNDMQVDRESDITMSKTKGLRMLNESAKKKLQPKLVNANVAIEHSKSTNVARELKRPAKGAASGRSASPGKLVPPNASHSHQPNVSGVSSLEESDSSTKSRPSRRSTPKRKRRASDNSLMVSPSPSDLHLTALRLTPDSSSQRLHVSSEDEHMGDSSSKPARTGRTRLIDRLDAPGAQSINTSSHTLSQEQRSNQPNDSVAPLGKVSATRLAKNNSDQEEKPSSVSVAAPSGRPRATYAKQRSYLSNMADSLESLSAPNSQPSSQEIYSQALNFTRVTSQMELDNDDSDEAEPFSRIKSIHELRRGGAIRKFDLELDTILEDVESSSKSRRIPGLLQLVSKLDELSFLRHFQDSGGLQRLMDCANASLDEVSATLMVLVIHCMVVAESSSPRVVLQMLNALYKLPPRLVSEPRSLTKVAKDRSQNLSKVLVKDITEFEEKRSKVSGQTCVAVNRTMLGSVESTLRTLIGLKEPFPKLPRALLDEILSNLAKAQDMVEGGGMAKHLETIRLLLSLLGIACANHEVTGSHLSTARITELGESVASIMKEARQAQRQIEHSCLRLIVSLSNNDATTCDVLVDGHLVCAVFQVIDDRFLSLASRASQEQEIDHAQLESVILAVGCLLNFAECADSARSRMLRLTASGKNMVDGLVDIFNSHVDQTSEALTIDQTQILVAFGYISALLCTLCLDPTARERISQSLKGKGLSPLFAAADTFLDHLQTVEAALGEEGGSSTGFTERFAAVLETVKQHDLQ
ncbi:uncharacterized protein Z520_12304 [Fonsecaea multimorphosa CBS 102226]|uniref:Wings apart-like protein C-terminal domain-containing protein n=1 Tax=Fonsecaea multimorphosa CBS 102226 TaxID=1442371 RepID=A0A0D2JFN1_9EURO|nr:uncharacterized protein Z520_12304 [Fonsecaea multimorphosa CBS 102226]KIX91977.1 hypothetical protein Z520_12304 [Fonsecaea multimorphosa CBS 102226]OAL19884.1 hypothetical protein AYO22_09411 [Fonsecaea multimorphosa]